MPVAMQQATIAQQVCVRNRHQLPGEGSGGDGGGGVPHVHHD